MVKKFSHPDYPFGVSDVFLTFGTHGSITVAIQVLCNRGDNILVPRPGFPLI